jgi:sialate O-acetylesterase
MTVTLDVGSKQVIHPPDKETVAGRIAACARGMVYNEDLQWESPSFEKIVVEGSTLRILLTHAAGLTAKGNTITDFEVAGSDFFYHPAEAKIEEYNGAPTIVVSSKDVAAPLHVRYGWASYVNSYIYNAAGLPLGTFASQ